MSTCIGRRLNVVFSQLHNCVTRYTVHGWCCWYSKLCDSVKVLLLFVTNSDVRDDECLYVLLQQRHLQSLPRDLKRRSGQLPRNRNNARLLERKTRFSSSASYIYVHRPTVRILLHLICLLGLLQVMLRSWRYNPPQPFARVLVTVCSCVCLFVCVTASMSAVCEADTHNFKSETQSLEDEFKISMTLATLNHE